MSILEIIGLIAALITIGSSIGWSTRKIIEIRKSQKERLSLVEREIEEYAQKATTHAKRQDLFIFISEELAQARHIASIVHTQTQKTQIITAGVITLWAFVQVDIEPGTTISISMWTGCAILLLLTIYASKNAENMNETISSTSKGFRNAMASHLEKSQGSVPINL